MVPYKQGVGSASGNYMQVFATAPSVGTSHDWTTASFFSQRSYAVQADLETSKYVPVYMIMLLYNCTFKTKMGLYATHLK